ADGDFPEDARKRAAAEIQHALSELKTVVQQPLGRAPRATPTTLAEEVERLERNDSPVRIEVAAPMDVPAELEALAQSVFREALRNAQKHADPTVVTVSA